MGIVTGRTARTPAQWILDQPREWRDQIGWATLDLSGSYKTAFDSALSDAVQIADPFGVVWVANQALDEVRTGIQNAMLNPPWSQSRPVVLGA